MTLQAIDTVYVQASREGIAFAADLTLVIAATAVAVTSIISLVLLARTLRATRQLAREASRRADPLLERSKSVAANVEFISASLRTDVEGLNRSVRALNDRLKQASDHMEQRIEDFNALMEVVQGEAEDVFIDTAATARGVRAGARVLTGGERTDAARLPTPPPTPDPSTE